MPLIQCPDCNKEMSDRANVCPSCGRRANVSAWKANVTGGDLYRLMVIAGIIITTASIWNREVVYALGGMNTVLIGILLLEIRGLR